MVHIKTLFKFIWISTIYSILFTKDEYNIVRRVIMIIFFGRGFMIFHFIRDVTISLAYGWVLLLFFLIKADIKHFMIRVLVNLIANGSIKLASTKICALT